MSKNNLNIVFSCKYHIVWCTKYRKGLLKPPVDHYLKKILYDVAHEFNGEIIELEVMPDHVHVLVEVDPQFGVNRLIRLMKGRSSRYIRSAFPALKKMKALWTNSYYVATVGGAPLEVVKKYSRNQKNASGKKIIYRKKRPTG